MEGKTTSNLDILTLYHQGLQIADGPLSQVKYLAGPLG